eukprot:tig00000219_g19454.t1
MQGAAAPSVRGITIRGLAPGAPAVLVTGGSRATIEDCDVSSAGWSGVEVAHEGTAPALRSNSVHSCGGAGLLFHRGARGLAEQNDVFANSRAGVEVEGGADPTVRGNRIHDGRQGGVHIRRGARGTVEGNDIFGNALAGIGIEDSEPVVRNNRVHDQRFGVVCCEASRGAVTGNLLARISDPADPAYAACRGIKVAPDCRTLLQNNAWR